MGSTDLRCYPPPVLILSITDVPVVDDAGRSSIRVQFLVNWTFVVGLFGRQVE